jgi:sugar phosphate isomerase/epimerase
VKPLFFPLLWCALILDSSGAESAAGTGKSFKGPLGLQMYSLRFYAPESAAGKLDKAKDLGFRTIEGGAPRGMAAEEYLKLLDERGMKLVSTGGDFATLQKDPDRVVAQAQKLGAKYVM